MPTFIKTGFWEKAKKGYKEWLNLDELIAKNSGGGSYLKYVALLTQSGTNPPTAVVLENTLGGSVTFGYDAVGNYKINFPIEYTSGKLWVSATANNNSNDAVINYYDAYPTGTVGDSINIVVIAPSDGSYENDALYNTSIEIRVYP